MIMQFFNGLFSRYATVIRNRSHFQWIFVLVNTQLLFFLFISGALCAVSFGLKLVPEYVWAICGTHQLFMQFLLGYLILIGYLLTMMPLLFPRRVILFCKRHFIRLQEWTRDTYYWK